MADRSQEDFKENLYKKEFNRPQIAQQMCRYNIKGLCYSDIVFSFFYYRSS